MTKSEKIMAASVFSGFAVTYIAVSAESLTVEMVLGVIGLLMMVPGVIEGRKEERRREREDRERMRDYIDRTIRSL